MKIESEDHKSGEGCGGRGGTVGVLVQVLFVGAVVILVGLVVSVFFSSRFVGVKYHKHMLDRAWKKVIEVGAESSRQSDWIDAHERHRDRLLELGYFEYREFPLDNMEAGSEKVKAMWKELCLTFTGCTTATMQEGEDTAGIVFVYDVPENMVEWERIIGKYNREE